MAYYDSIADAWGAETGDQGEALKRFVVNRLVLDRLPDLRGRSVLDLGAGNGYLARLLVRAKRPDRMVITDLSDALLRMAVARRPVRSALYARVDYDARTSG